MNGTGSVVPKTSSQESEQKSTVGFSYLPEGFDFDPSPVEFEERQTQQQQHNKQPDVDGDGDNNSKKRAYPTESNPPQFSAGMRANDQ